MAVSLRMCHPAKLVATQITTPVADVATASAARIPSLRIVHSSPRERDPLAQRGECTRGHPRRLARRCPARDPHAMRALPRGEVTLLFTDIDGSTRLLHE